MGQPLEFISECTDKPIEYIRDIATEEPMLVREENTYGRYNKKKSVEWWETIVRDGFYGITENKKHLSQPKSPTNLDFLSKFSYDIERNVVQERSTQVALTEKEIHWL